MARLFVFGDPGKLTPTLRAALEHPHSPIRVTDYVFLLSDKEGVVGQANLRNLIAERLTQAGITPNGTDAVLASGNINLYLAACECFQNLTGQTPRRIIPESTGFRIRSGPLGDEVESIRFTPPRLPRRRERR